jgi:hypothetical protein
VFKEIECWELGRGELRVGSPEYRVKFVDGGECRAYGACFFGVASQGWRPGQDYFAPLALRRGQCGVDCWFRELRLGNLVAGSKSGRSGTRMLAGRMPALPFEAQGRPFVAQGKQGGGATGVGAARELGRGGPRFPIGRLGGGA